MPIRIGKPSPQLKSIGAGTHVQLYFLKNGRVVNLHHGQHPCLDVAKSDIKISIDYSANETRGDIVTLLEEALLSETNRLLSESDLRVSRGPQSVQDRHYHFSVDMMPPIKGLHFDVSAIAEVGWFVD